MAIDPLSALSSLFNPAPATSAQINGPQPASGGADSDASGFGTILARLRSATQPSTPAQPQQPMLSSILGGVGAMPNVRGQSMGSAFASGLGAGIKNAQDRADRLTSAKAAADIANRNYQLELMKAQWGQKNALAQQAEKAKEFETTSAETKRYHDILNQYYQNGKGSANPKAMSPRDAVLTQQRIQQNTGYLPGSKDWPMLPDEQKQQRFDNFAQQYEKSFGQPWPFDIHGGKLLPPAEMPNLPTPQGWGAQAQGPAGQSAPAPVPPPAGAGVAPPLAAPQGGGVAAPAAPPPVPPAGVSAGANAGAMGAAPPAAPPATWRPYRAKDGSIKLFNQSTGETSSIDNSSPGALAGAVIGATGGGTNFGGT